MPRSARAAASAVASVVPPRMRILDMADTPDAPWLTIVGIGEDGLNGLSPAARDALERAALVAGSPRHLAPLPGLRAESLAWPLPCSAGVPMLPARRGDPNVLLASGAPFWFRPGSRITRRTATPQVGEK